MAMDAQERQIVKVYQKINGVEVLRIAKPCTKAEKAALKQKYPPGDEYRYEATALPPRI